jgi:hypothetical protein
VPSGLASLSVELPADDARRWATHMFTTARGDIRIEATAMSERFLDSLRRVGMALAAALFAALLPMLFARRVPEGARRAATSTMIIAGSLGLLAGVFPIAGVLLAIAGMVLKASPLVKR